MNRILNTEDDLFMANICRERIELEGFEVKLAHNGRVAIDLLKSHPPHVVMLDLMLPEIDGIGVLGFIRSRESLRTIEFFAGGSPKLSVMKDNVKIASL